MELGNQAYANAHIAKNNCSLKFGFLGLQGLFLMICRVGFKPTFMIIDALEKGLKFLHFHGYLVEVQKCPESLCRAEMGVNFSKPLWQQTQES